MRPIKIDIPLYQVTVYLVGSRSSFQRKVAALDLGCTTPKGAAGLCHAEGVNVLVGVFDQEIDTLVHELTHAALFILKRVSIDPQASNGEPMAYLLEHLFKRATAALRK